jgi:hypothetical protein
MRQTSSAARQSQEPKNLSANFPPQKPQQNRVSSPLRPEKSSNSIKTIQIKVSRSWHSSFHPTHIIKAVEIREARRQRRASLVYLCAEIVVIFQ